MYIDAGAIDRTIQLTYQPQAMELAPPAAPGRQVLRAFRLQTYDHTATALNAPFRYPVRLSLRVGQQEIAASGNDSARLLLAWHDPKRDKWLPLVTRYRASDATLLVRILQPGLFALMAFPSPVPG